MTLSKQTIERVYLTLVENEYQGEDGRILAQAAITAVLQSEEMRTLIDICKHTLEVQNSHHWCIMSDGRGYVNGHLEAALAPFLPEEK